MTRPASVLRATSRAVLALMLAAGLPPGVAAQPADIQPEATRLLKASTDFLASQKQFSVETRNSLEIVTTSGQKIQFNHQANAIVQRPDRMRAERTGDLVEQTLFYDGKSLSLLNKSNKAYATTAAPDSLDRMLDFARVKLDIVAPGGDLFHTKAYDILMTDVTQGFVVGKAVIGGVRCDHLAFRAPHVDWQIWIQEGAQPLPRKLVITTRDVVNAPQFTVEVTNWNLAPKFTAQTFVLAPPKGGQKVEFMPFSASAK